MITLGRFAAALAAASMVVASVSSAPAQETHEVEVVDFDYVPDVLEGLAVGDEILWTWTGDQQHTVTAYEGADFDSGAQGPGSTFSQTFPGGTVLYRCTLHSSINNAGECVGQCGTLAQADDDPADEDPPPTADDLADADVDDMPDTGIPVPAAAGVAALVLSGLAAWLGPLRRRT